MLGHVAQSVGQALPGGGGGAATFISQTLVSSYAEDVVVPSLAVIAFIEAVGCGGLGSGNKGGGGAGNDAIITVTPGETLSVASTRDSAGTVIPTTIKRSSTVLLSANVGTFGGSGGAGGTGKYPGTSGSNSNNVGGGRLAGKIQTKVQQTSPPVGAGSIATGGSGLVGGVGAACLTFFTTYDAALAFANSLYGGNWQP